MSTHLDLIIHKCPGCGATLELIPGSTGGRCEYCGSPFTLTARPAQTAGEPAPQESSGHAPPPSARERIRATRKILLKAFKREHGIDLGKDPVAKRRIDEALAKLLPELDTSPSVEINLPFITADASGPKHLVHILHRDEISSL